VLRLPPVLLLLLVTSGAREQAPGLLDRCRYPEALTTRVSLPLVLREISGLAMTSDGRLFGHNDEQGVVFELDPDAGLIRQRWIFNSGVREDFEGIAVADKLVLLLTSTGRLYDMPLPTAPAALLARRVETGLSSDCEFEGLAWDATNRVLLLPCKVIRRNHDKAGLIVFRWDLARRTLAAPARLVVPRNALRKATGLDEFAVSSIEVDPRSGQYLVLSARDHAVLELTTNGTVVGVKRLSRKLHPQAEGLTVSAEGDLLISDEGRKGPATLARYRCQG
jgi:uncharacterized protein YjiK